MNIIFLLFFSHLFFFLPSLVFVGLRDPGPPCPARLRSAPCANICTPHGKISAPKKIFLKLRTEQTWCGGMVWPWACLLRFLLPYTPPSKFVTRETMVRRLSVAQVLCFKILTPIPLHPLTISLVSFSIGSRRFRDRGKDLQGVGASGSGSACRCQ